jgi:uncharacterized protein YgiM (DUF1202 family)
MRAFIVILGISICGTAAADRKAVVAGKELRLRARPGETAAVVARAERGEQLTVIDEWGRWLRVRHGKRVGWVTRTQVVSREAAAPRTRPARGGFSGKPVADALRVTVEADEVRGFDDPRTKATCVLELWRGDQVTVIGKGHDGWMLVESDGVVGWIPDAATQPAAPRAAASAAEPEVRITVEDELPEAAPRARPPARTNRTRAGTLVGGAGAQAFAMLQTGGAESMAIASGPATAIAASGRYRVAGDLWLGAGADAELGTATLTYYTADEQSAPMASTAMAIDARAALAYGRGWQVAARAGYHYATLEVESERAEPMLLGEATAGVTVGLGGALPIGDKLSVTASLDVMPAGVQVPAELPPGVLYATSMRAAWARGTVAYRLPAHLVAALSYRGGMASVELTDGAPTPSTASRTDQSHALTAGLGLRW